MQELPSYTKLDLFKALSSYNFVRKNVYHAQRIVVQVAFFFRYTVN